MTRMCSYAKISKGGAGSVDELRDTGSIILCAAPLPTNQNFFSFFFFFPRRNEQRANAQESCCASRTCCLLLTVINWNNNNKERKCVYQRWKTRSQLWMLGTSSTDTDYRLNLTLISLHMTWEFSRLQKWVLFGTIIGQFYSAMHTAHRPMDQQWSTDQYTSSSHGCGSTKNNSTSV